MAATPGEAPIRTDGDACVDLVISECLEEYLDELDFGRPLDDDIQVEFVPFSFAA